MQEEIQRILQMVEDGRLTRDQAAELIGALAETGGTEDPPTGPGADAERPGDAGGEHDAEAPEGAHEQYSGDAGRHRFRHSGRRRHRSRGRADFFDDRFYDEIERAVSAGTRALRNVFDSTSILGGHGWYDERNTSTLSKAEDPEGSGFRCVDNRISVSTVRGIRLTQAELCGNELNAAALADLEIGHGKFNGNAISGSSLKHVQVSHGDVADNHFNGAQIARMSITQGKLQGCRFQGTQIRDLTLSSSSLDAARLDGVKLRSVAIAAESHLSGVKMTGVAGTDWSLNDAQLNDVVFNGWRIRGLTMNRVGLEHCRFKNDHLFQHSRTRHRYRDIPSDRDLHVEQVVMKHCEFVNCTFDSTIIRHCNVENLRFENVDFSRMTLSGSDQVTAMAERADVA